MHEGDFEDEEIEGDRYVINEFEDGTTWSILDTQTHNVYALLLSRLSNFIFHIDLVELFTHMESKRYLSYAQEIMSTRIEASDPRIAPQLIQSILNALEQGEDIANPIDIAMRCGASLHGEPVAWPAPKEMQ